MSPSKIAEWDFERSIASVRLMTDFGAEYGLSATRCLSATGLKERDLHDSAAIVSARQELTVIRNLLSHLGEMPGLGLKIGQRYHFTAFGVLGFAMVSSPNAFSALELALRYFQLTFAFTQFRVSASADQTQIVLADESLPEDVRAFIVERDSAALVTVQRDLFSARAALLAACIKAKPARDLQVYKEFYGVTPEFSADANMMIMSTSVLSERLPQANPLALMAAEEQCRQLMDRHKSRAGLSGKVREILAHNCSRMPDMDEVADSLFVTSRTLRRRLIEENTTFLKLRDEVRLALAEEFLLNFSLSVEQIADRLGYSESSSFNNAFKRWTGSTPNKYRMSSAKTALK